MCLQDHALLDGLFSAVTVFAGPVCVPAPCAVGWSVSVLSLFAGPICVHIPCTIGWYVSVLSLCLQDQYVFLYHALLDGLFQCCHCVCRTSMCSCTMHCWMVCLMVSLCLQDQYVFLHHALLDGLFQCCHCVCRTNMCSCAMHCWMVCFNVVTVFAGPVCVPAPCTVGWSVSMLSLCLQDQYVFLCHALLDGLFQ